jgi:hypothetical protein
MPQSFLETKPPAPNSLFNDDSKFIVVSSLPTNCSDTFTKLIVTSMFGQSNQSLLNDDFQLFVKLIPILTSEGARAPSSMLIVGCGYYEISFHFCEDCRIFREGVKDDLAITMANHTNSKLQLIVECLFLLRDEDNSETMTSSLLLFCVKDALAIMMAPLANFSLQLIVETPSLLLLRDFERPAITAVMTGSFSFKFIVASHSEGARFAPNFDRPSDLDSSKFIVIFLKISFHFCEDYRIFVRENTR